MKQSLILLAVLLLAACSSSAPHSIQQAFVETPENSTMNLGSCKNPISIAAYSHTAGSNARDLWIDSKYPGHRKVSVSGTRCNGRSAEVATFRNADGKKVKLYFDTSTWAGHR